MSEYTVIEGELTASADVQVGIVAGRFNSIIVEHLLDGCLDTLRRQGVRNEGITLVRVPGAFEIPVAAKRMAERGRYDALIALGAVIRGATPHFDYVAGSCVRGLAEIGLVHGIPVAFGVLTTDTLEQAIERAGSKGGNKGAEAALTALEMIAVLRKLGA